MSTSATEELMSPDASPGDTSKNSGVRRVNNWPLLLMMGAGLVFVLVMAIVAADRAEQQNRPVVGPKEKGGSTTIFAQDITGGYSDGFIPDGTQPPEVPADGLAAPQSAAPVNPASGIQVVRPMDLEAPPLPPGGGNGNGDGYNAYSDEQERIRIVKMQQFQEAVKAKSSVEVVAPRSSGSSSDYSTSSPSSTDEALARIAAARQKLQSEARSDPTAAYQARLAQLRGGNGSGGTSGVSAGSSDDSPFVLESNRAAGNNVEQFGNQKGGDRWALNSQPEAPRKPYVLQTGFVLPATLISGINSELPGQIMAQVSADVYDTPSGRYKLIPQGTRLVGAYSNDVAFGQSRVLIGWQRLVFPDGKTMDIGSMPGADSAGYSGFNDVTNNHYVRLFASAFLMSGVTAGISLSQDRGQSSGFGQETTASSAMSEALGQQLGQVTAQLISKNLNVAPTLEIRPGYRFNVIVTKDMVFSKPYVAFDY